MATSLSTINGSASQFSPAKLKQIKSHKPKYQSPQSYMLAQAQESHSLPSKSTTTPHQVSRRASLSFSMALLLHQLHIETSRADEGNGLWLTGPLPVPTVSNSKLSLLSFSSSLSIVSFFIIRKCLIHCRDRK